MHCVLDTALFGQTNLHSALYPAQRPSRLVRSLFGRYGITNLRCQPRRHDLRGKSVIPGAYAGRLLNRSAKGQENWHKLKVSDIMTKPVLSVTPQYSILQAMKLLVRRGVSGMPVVDSDGFVLGTVSGYDILAVETLPAQPDMGDGFFPPVDRCIKQYGGDRQAMWQAFKERQKTIMRSSGETIGDIMQEAAIVVQDASVDELADLLLQEKRMRVVVVDKDEKLVGIVSRGDVMRAYLSCFQEFIEESIDQELESGVQGEI